MNNILTSRSIKTIIDENHEEIVSDIPTNSLNAIKIYGEHAVIYTSKGDYFTILKEDLDDFIIDHTWGFYNSNFAKTQITLSQIVDKCNRYNLDFDAFRIDFSEIDNLGKQKNIAIHRYLMGFYNTEKRKEYKDKYIETLREYSLYSIDDLVVDHDIYNSRIGEKRVYNYSNQMRIVPQAVNGQVKHTEAKRNDLSLFPIIKDTLTGLFHLEIKEVQSPLSKTIATVVDNDVLGVNVQRIQSEMCNKYNEYVFGYLLYSSKNADVLPKDKFAYKRKLEAKMRSEIIELGTKFESQDKVRIIFQDGLSHT